MAIDWEKFESEIDDILDEAEAETEVIIKEKALSWLPLTEEDVKDLIPEPADTKRLAELMRIVKSAESDNEKITKIFDKTKGFGKIMLKLLEKFTRVS